MSMGWTLDYVKHNVDLPTLRTLTRYWKSFPPVHVLVRDYAGYKAPSKGVTTGSEGAAEPSIQQAEQMQQLFDMVPARTFPKPVART